MPCISGVESAFSCCRDTVVSSTASLLGKIWCFRLFPSFSHVPHENTSLLLLVESEKCTFLFFVTPFTFYYEVLKHSCWRDAVLSSISSWILLGQTWCFRFPHKIFVCGGISFYDCQWNISSQMICHIVDKSNHPFPPTWQLLSVTQSSRRNGQ